MKSNKNRTCTACTYRHHVEEHVEFPVRALHKARQEYQSQVGTKDCDAIRTALEQPVQVTHQHKGQADELNDASGALAAGSQVNGQTETIASNTHEENASNDTDAERIQRMRLSDRQPHCKRLSVCERDEYKNATVQVHK